jgi:hypothetical protein
MREVNTYTMPIATSVTGTTQVHIGYADALNVFVPGTMTAWAGSSTINLRLCGAPQSGTSARTSYFYDYVNLTPAQCVITITTGGAYEIPNASGGQPYVRIEFDVATTQATAGLVLTTSRISY